MSIMQVPEFRGYFPSEEMMDSQQRKFYRNVERSLDQGEFINIEGHISYVFVYLYKLLGQWNSRGFENLSEFLIYISELYSHENKLSDYCLFWAHDCLLGLNKFEEFLEKTLLRTTQHGPVFLYGDVNLSLSEYDNRVLGGDYLFAVL